MENEHAVETLKLIKDAFEKYHLMFGMIDNRLNEIENKILLLEKKLGEHNA